MSWLRRRSMENWQSILMAIAVSILMIILTSVVIYFTHVIVPHETRYEDSELRAWATNQVAEKDSTVSIFKMWSESLHGLDHKTLIVAANIARTDKYGAKSYEGVLALFDKPKQDYSFRFVIHPISRGKQLQPAWADVEAQDLDGDGTKELVLRWNGRGMDDMENYIGVIGWDKGYKYLGTIPTFDCPEAAGTMIPPAGEYLRIEYGSAGTAMKASVMRNCSHLLLRDIDQDGKVELLCAHMIWRWDINAPPEQYESHGSDHNYVIRVLTLEGKKLLSDWRWNGGTPLYLNDKYPAQNFQFTEKMIEMGMPLQNKVGT